jgi:glycine/D-amino acid oxidase-like deaminating enzyme
MAKSADAGLRAYIDTVTSSGSMPGINDDFGGLTLRQGGYLDTVRYIEAVRRWICRDNIFITEDLNPDKLTVTEDAVYYNDYRASRVILCQGEQALKNSWFGWAPVIPLKGETLIIQSDWNPQQIVNRGVYIVPAGRNELNVGATYDFNDHERSITAKGRIELEEKLRALTSIPYTVTEHQWSMRPTTPDRRPLLGTHPASDRVAIFNGLGTKGTSIAPYFSDVLISWLENEKDLTKEINVNRYKLLYSKFTK